jgi:hypothetical protein
MDFNKAYNTLVKRRKNVVLDKQNGSGMERLEFLSSSPKELSLVEIVEVMDRLLDKGIVYNEEGDNGFYVLASVETYLKYAEAIIDNDDTYSLYASVETSLKAISAVGAPTRQNNYFNSSVTKILNVFPDDDRLLDKGIVEAGNFSVLNLLLKEGFASNAEAMDRILDKGIVLSKVNGTVNIAGVETYLKYAEAIGLTQTA